MQAVAGLTLSFLSLPELFDAPPKSFLKVPKQQGAGVVWLRPLNAVTRAAARTCLLLCSVVSLATVLAVLVAARTIAINLPRTTCALYPPLQSVREHETLRPLIGSAVA